MFGKSRKPGPPGNPEPVAEREPEYNLAVGLDIGTTKVVAFVGMQNEQTGKVEILGHGETISLGVQRGQVINLEKTMKAISHAIKAACASSHVAIDTVVAGIAGQHIKSFHSTEEIKRKNPDDMITAEDVKQLIDEVFRVNVPAGNRILDAIPQEFFVDENKGLDDPIGVTGTQLGSEFNIISGSEQHIRNVVRCVQQCDLNLDGLILEPLASASVVLDEREKEAGVALVDIGGGTTDVAVFYNGMLRHTAVIPIGGDVITDDIKCVFKGLIKKDAEHLKLEHGSCVPDTSNDVILSIPGIKECPKIEIRRSELAAVIAARLDEILTRVMEEIQKSGYLDNLGCGIVLTGGGALLKDIKAHTEYFTGLPVRVGRPEEGVTFSEETRQKYDNPMYSTALGLMLYGIEKDEKEEREGLYTPKRPGNPEIEEKDPADAGEQKPKSNPYGGYVKGKVKRFLSDLFIPGEDEFEEDDDVR